MCLRKAGLDARGRLNEAPFFRFAANGVKTAASAAALRVSGSGDGSGGSCRLITLSALRARMEIKRSGPTARATAWCRTTCCRTLHPLGRSASSSWRGTCREAMGFQPESGHVLEGREAHVSCLLPPSTKMPWTTRCRTTSVVPLRCTKK
eukprot:6192483-Pleurochrysis_carterae.AAC.5